jgi:hypothetical protein
MTTIAQCPIPTKKFEQTFLHTDKTHGLLFDLSAGDYPSLVYGWDEETLEIDNQGSTVYGFIHEGEATLEGKMGSITLSEGFYFCIPNDCRITGGKGIAIQRFQHLGMFSAGGPVEPKGRLRYIDSCTDTCLIQPVKMGDPCLNALYFPPGIDQTPHTHPSMRAGIIHSGYGACILPEGEVVLTPGMRFVIVQDGVHSFRTDNDQMTVIAYHPDTDFGPTDEFHPMLNRTVIDGVAASELRKTGQA